MNDTLVDCLFFSAIFLVTSHLRTRSELSTLTGKFVNGKYLRLCGPCSLFKDSALVWLKALQTTCEWLCCLQVSL